MASNYGGLKKFIEIGDTRHLADTWREEKQIDSEHEQFQGVVEFLEYVEKDWNNRIVDTLDNSQIDKFLEICHKIDDFAILSFGEGEWSFLLDNKTKNEREVYTNEAKDLLDQALQLSTKNNVYLTTILGTIAHSNEPHLVERAVRYLASRNIVLKDFRNARIFYTLCRKVYERDKEAKQKLTEFIKWVKEVKPILVGGKHLEEVKKKLGCMDLIETPTYGSTCWIDKISKDVINSKGNVFLYQTGIASNCIIANVFEKKGGIHIDIGSLWDVVFGIGTRKELCYDPPLMKPSEI